MAIDTSTIEASLTAKLNNTSVATEGKEFLLLGKAVEALTPSITKQDMIDEGIARKDAVTTEGNTQTSRVTSEGDTQTSRVTTEGDTQTARVTGEGDTQVGRVQAEGSSYVTLTGDQEVTGKSLSSTLLENNTRERIAAPGLGASGTISYDILVQQILYYMGDATGNFTLNFRGDWETTLDSALPIGESLTAVFLCTNGGTAYYNSTVQIDGVTVTPKWQGGEAPSEGNASSIDAYTYTILKTGPGTFTVLANQTMFA